MVGRMEGESFRFWRQAEGMKRRRERDEGRREEDRDRGYKISPITLLTKALYDTLGLKAGAHTHTHTKEGGCTHTHTGQMATLIRKCGSNLSNVIGTSLSNYKLNISELALGSVCIMLSLVHVCKN